MPAARWQGVWSGAAALAAFGIAAAIANAVHGAIAFGLVACAATAAYFGVGSLGPALSPLPASNERRAHVHPD